MKLHSATATHEVVKTAPKRIPEQGSKKRSSYLPTLDGWRAIAILLVMLDHSSTMSLGPFSTNRFHGMGGFGVQIFFAISGVLICSRLLDEEEKTGALQIRSFYIRRLFRIQPAALAYLGFILILTLFHRLPPFATGLVAAAVLVRNFFGMDPQNTSTRGWATIHYWSLSVEEHFYLVLPSLLFFVKRWRTQVLLGLALVGFGWRAYLWSNRATRLFSVEVRTDTCLCFLFFAAGIAVLLRQERIRHFAVRYVRSFFVLPIAVLLAFSHGRILALAEFVPVFMVISTMLRPTDLVSKFLESAPLRFAGRISYSAYLWQEIFLTGAWAPTIRPFGWLNSSWLVWPAVFAAAIASYYLIEKPFIRLGHRLAPSATQGRPI